VFDLRQEKLLETIKAHSMNVRSLAISYDENHAFSGSNEGSVKAWELPTLHNVISWEDIHSKQTFVRKPGVFAAPVSTFGVMQVKLTSQHMYSCGSDGRMVRISYEEQQL